MKVTITRALAVAAALALAVPAFAQVTINGYYRVGGAYNAPDSGDSTAAFQDRIRLNLSFAAPDDMFGFKARLQADSSGTTSGLANLFADSLKTTKNAAATLTVSASDTVTIPKDSYLTAATISPPATVKYGQAYAKFLDGTLKLTAGKLDVADYMVVENTGNIYLGLVATDAPVLKGSILGGGSGNTTGAILQAWPIEGLSAAVTMRADGTKPELNHFGVDAYYLLPGIGKVLLASQLGSFASSLNDLDKSFASVGFSYVGVKGLTATGAYRYNGDLAGKAAHGAVAIVEYSAAAFKVPLWVNVSADADLTNSHFYVEGEAVYTIIPQIKVRAYGAYTDNTAVNANIKLGGVANKSLYGADLVFPVGKAEAMLGLAYGDVSNIQIPLLIKANF